MGKEYPKENAGRGIELIPPGELPAEWDSWPNEHHEAFKASHNIGSWHFVFRSIEGGNGLGDDISAEAAEPSSRSPVR